MSDKTSVDFQNLKVPFLSDWRFWFMNISSFYYSVHGNAINMISDVGVSSANTDSAPVCALPWWSVCQHNVYAQRTTQDVPGSNLKE